MLPTPRICTGASSRTEYERIPAICFCGEWVYAPWALLLVDAGPRLAARHLRRLDRARLLLDSGDPRSFRAEAAGLEVRLDVRVLRGVHPGVRHDPSHGDLEYLAREL